MLGRGVQTFVVAYLILGVISTGVNEAIAVMQGGSQVVGAFTSGASPVTIALAVVQWWVIPILTWPAHVLGWAMRTIAIRG